MSYQITISDQERDILARTAQARSQSPSAAVSIEQLVHEIIDSLQFSTQNHSPSVMGKPVINWDFIVPATPQPDLMEKPAQLSQTSEDWSSQEALANKQREAVQNPLSLEQLKIQAQPLSQLYTFENADEIWPYLEQHQYLVPTLIELPSVAQKFFPDEGLLLEYVPDPEIPDLEQLMVDIVTKLDVDTAHDLFLQFNRDWRGIAGKKAKRDLCIMERYV